VSASILLVTLEFPPRKGGIATYLANLVRALPKGAVRVLAPKMGGTDALDVAQETPVCRHRLLSRWLYPHWLPALYWTARAVRRDRPGMIVVSHLLSMGTLAWFIKRWHGVPYAVIVHGMGIALALEAGGRRMALAKRVLADAERVVANSVYTARLAESAGVPRSRLLVAHPSPSFTAADAATGAASAREARERHGLGSDYVVLTLGRLVTRKGFDTLISATALLWRQGRALTLAIAGEGPDRQRLEEFAWTQEVSERVRFLGAIEPGELPALYAASDVFALAPRSSGGDVEGFGIVYLEAGLLGKPVIGTRTGGVPEAVADGVTGLLVPPADVPALAEAIAKLMDDPGLSARLGLEGRQRVARGFDPAVQLSPFVEFLTRE
jgi:phosphatidylinositol alpha-1,6-mannosyltransferase